MYQGLFEIIENTPLTADVMKMRLRGDISEITRPGSFVNIKLDGLFLRRPISVCDARDGVLTIIYKVVGRGTERLRDMTEGKLDLLVGLGNGYDTSLSGERPLLVGGGVGTPPLYMLARQLVSEGKQPVAVLGFNKKSEVFLEDELRSLGIEVRVTTADGSYGTRGFVTDAIGDIDYTYFYACGPESMLRALHRASKTSGQLSFEERMGCGFGACMGCSCKTLTGYKRICKDGPVMKKEELLWED